MDHKGRPTTLERPRALRRPRSHTVFHATFRAGLVALAFAAFTSAAQGPGYGAVPSTPVATATLTYTNGEAIITGSVASLFDGGAFAGPNSAEKRDRARIGPDPVGFSAGFDDARELIAAMRVVPLLQDQPLLQGSSLQQMAAAQTKTSTPPGPRLVVASIDPIAGTPALSAIDAIATSATPPAPSVLSDELAYARAEMPKATSDLLDVRGKKVSEKDLWCLSTAIYFEARGESYRGQVAVAQVVLNRLQHRLYPKTICGVVYQNQQMRNACQFSFACDGIPERVTEAKAWEQAEEIAKGALKGTLYLTEVGNATHYHATYVSPDWAPRMKKLAKIGLHVFYQFKHNWSFG
jgi:hypothetical protein